MKVWRMNDTEREEMTMARKMTSIWVSWGRQTWENGERGHEGFGFDITRKGIEQNFAGSMTSGGTKWTGVSVKDVTALLIRIREKMLEKTGRAGVGIEWEDPDTGFRLPTEIVWREGVYSSGRRERQEDQQNPPTGNRQSKMVDLLVEYLSTGSDAALGILGDYMKDTFGLEN